MKFEILVLEAWDYAHWNLVEHCAWIYVPTLMPVLVILQNCKLNFAKISQKFQILHLESWDYAHWNLVEHCAWIYVPHLIPVLVILQNCKLKFAKISNFASRDLGLCSLEFG